MVAAALGPNPHFSQRRLLMRHLLIVLAMAPLLGWSVGAASQGLPSLDPHQPRLAQTYPQQPVNPWTFRPRPPTNERGTPPAPTSEQRPAAGYPQGRRWPSAPQPYPGATPPGGYPGAYPGTYPGTSGGYDPYGQRTYGQRSRSAERPSLEVALLEQEAYVQQPILVRLDVLSSGNLATASPELSGFDALLLEEIEGPTTSVRGSGRARRIVNSYLLALTPLRAGTLEIGPFKVSGTLAGGVPFSAVAAAPSQLEVRPVVATERPWLPLRALRLTRELDDTAPLTEGRPTTLTLRLQATGGLGTQLPSLASMLTSDAFRAYPEQTRVETRLSDDGRTLEGTRTEVYTLVPYSGGRLQLPEVRVNWWNVEHDRRERSGVPIRTLSVAGEAGPFGFGRGSVATTGAGEGWVWFWLPVGGILLLLIGYWAGVWYRLRGPGGRGEMRRKTRAEAQARRSAPGARTGLAQAAPRIGAQLGQALRQGLRRLDPRPPIVALWRHARARLAALMPASMRVYRCARDAEDADSASDWALRFQRSASRNLLTPTREPLPRMADRLLRLRPGADGERLRALIQQLDQALYNGGELDLQRWKRDLRRALRPGWGALRGLLGNRLQRARLPALNPGSSGA
ncbi:BatD family protein [Halochromatium salexigens]|uniref:Oxygen tolerance protein BatD n=1 Tax=Halochromatium salexigens TaxID=49447 RepID=A0AAJ0UHH7_HALSE|nr:BatD family protein [Halochromatium salexigens]MBK5931388.1 hypothetical protein [Halochromatium salexigens]